MHRHREQEALEGTGRIEAFSDGVIAIIVTILILEIHVPELDVVTNAGALHALVPCCQNLLLFS